MGFDIYIKLNLLIDVITGLPVVYRYKNEKLIRETYQPAEYQVPEKYRKFISQHGRVFHNYIRNFDTTNNETSVDEFLCDYPSWAEISEQIDESRGWTKEDHHNFQEALIWFKEKDIFSIYWSY